MEKVNENRIGFVRFSYNYFYNSELFKKCLDALVDFEVKEYQRHYDYMDIYGICDKFDVIEEGAEIPQYLVIFDTVDNDILSYRYEKWQSK